MDAAPLFYAALYAKHTSSTGILLTLQHYRMNLSFKTGDILIREGALEKDLYILNSGTLAIFKNGKYVTEIAKPGSIIGELSGILRKPRTATVIALSEVSVTRVEGDANVIVKKNPELAATLVFNLAERLENTTARFARSEQHTEAVPVFSRR